MNEEKTNNNQNVEYAVFWIRFLASLADGVLLYIFGLFIRSSFGIDPFNPDTKSSAGIIATLIIAIFGFSYDVLFWVHYDGATPGKKLFGIKITKEDGKPITYAVAIVRYFSKIISIVPFFLGLLWVAWDKKKQGWHDKIAGTVAIRTKTIKFVAERVS